MSLKHALVCTTLSVLLFIMGETVALLSKQQRILALLQKQPGNQPVTQSPNLHPSSPPWYGWAGETGNNLYQPYRLLPPPHKQWCTYAVWHMGKGALDPGVCSLPIPSVHTLVTYLSPIPSADYFLCCRCTGRHTGALALSPCAEEGTLAALWTVKQVVLLWGRDRWATAWYHLVLVFLS